MLPGLNTDVSHAGVGYHVQTEDLGEKNPIILTLVYKSGAVVLREQLEYGDIFGGRLSVREACQEVGGSPGELADLVSRDGRPRALRATAPARAARRPLGHRSPET